MTKKLTLVLLKVLIFCVSYFFTFLFLFVLFRCFNEFEVLPETVCLPASVLFSAVVQIGFIIFWVLTNKYAKKTRLKNFLEMNYSYFLLTYLISIFCIASIKSEIVWTLEKLEKILSIEWTIFSISITIFLVWNVLILQFLKNKQPTKGKNSSLIDKIGYIRKKADFHGPVSYTHLDVYKRQALWTYWSAPAHIVSQSRIARRGGTLKEKGEAVSYTHLDVYKRQRERTVWNWNLTGK